MQDKPKGRLFGRVFLLRRYFILGSQSYRSDYLQHLLQSFSARSWAELVRGSPMAGLFDALAGEAPMEGDFVQLSDKERSEFDEIT
jgi:hypothetical protein